MPMLLPHSGAIAGVGHVLLRRTRARRASASATSTVGRFDLGEQPRLRVHLADEVVHARERVGVGVDDEVDAVVERVERRRR